MNRSKLFQFFKEKRSNLFLLFIIVQPVLDILTAFSIYYIGSSITFSLVLRMLIMLIGFFFVFTFSGSGYGTQIKKYLMLLLVVIGIGFISNFFMKPVFSIFSEVQFIAKALYFIVMFLTYVLIFTAIKQENAILKFQKYITYAMIIAGSVLVFTLVTGTGFDTYEYKKAGNKGWFFSGNELSAILSIGFPIVLLYAIQQTTTLKKLYFWIPVVLLGISALMIGTKVGHLSIILICILSPIILLINLFIHKNANSEWKKNIKLNLFINVAILAGFLLITPITPAFGNTAEHYSTVNEEYMENQEGEVVGEESEAEVRENELIKEKIANSKFFNNRIVTVLLSSRDVYLYRINNMFLDAPIQQKIFGMGYAGNWEETPKLIEMDFFDLFYSFGIFGFILYIFPFGLTLYLLIKNIITNKLNILKPIIIYPLLSLGLGTGTAFIAGHVFYAPAVSIYMALILAFILSQTENKQNT
ncbi:O-antigen ligase family protein [Sutcliffiella cohnii]